MSRDIRTQKELEDKIGIIIEKKFQQILRSKVNNIRFATVVSVNTSQSTVSVLLGGNTTVINNVKYQSGALDNIRAGDSCYIISSDPTFSSNLRAVVFSNGTNNSGSIWWEEIARITLDAVSDRITASFPVRKYLKIIAFTEANGGTVVQSLTFNNDTGNNYAERLSASGAAESTNVSATSITFRSGTLTTGTGLYIGEVDNVASSEKTGYGHGVNSATAGAANIPSRAELAFKWANTSTEIVRADLVNTGTGDFAIGSELIILGHD